MIKLVAVKPRDETRQIAYFMVDEYDFVDGSVPVALDTNTKILNWLKKKEDFYMLLILQKLYREGETWADWKRFKKADNTELEAMKEWIAKGCKNKDGTIIRKQAWQSTHPKLIGLKSQIADATTISDIKKIMEIIIENI